MEIDKKSNKVLFETVFRGLIKITVSEQYQKEFEDWYLKKYNEKYEWEEENEQ